MSSPGELGSESFWKLRKGLWGLKNNSRRNWQGSVYLWNQSQDPIRDKQQICHWWIRSVSLEIKQAEFCFGNCYSRQTRMPSHSSLLLRDKPVCNGFLEKVHSIPVCLRFKAWKEKNKCWVLTSRSVILLGSGLLTTLGISSPLSLGSAFPHCLL